LDCARGQRHGSGKHRPGTRLSSANLSHDLADVLHSCNNPPTFVYLQGSGAEKIQIVKKIIYGGDRAHFLINLFQNSPKPFTSDRLKEGRVEVKKVHLILGFGVMFFFLWGVALSWG
jgi:hypothetical protein